MDFIKISIYAMIRGLYHLLLFICLLPSAIIMLIIFWILEFFDQRIYKKELYDEDN
jgi:chromate transport protein ChrA